MSRVHKVERGAMQSTPVTGEPVTQPSGRECIRQTQDGAQATLQRVQLARDTERHFATRSKSTPLSSPAQCQEERGRTGASSLLKRFVSPRKITPESAKHDDAQDPSSTSESATLISTLQDENHRVVSSLKCNTLPTGKVSECTRRDTSNCNQKIA
jgi:hypothetical protein